MSYSVPHAVRQHFERSAPATPTIHSLRFGAEDLRGALLGELDERPAQVLARIGSMGALAAIAQGEWGCR